MNQNALYTVLEESGFTILMFADHPQFFGNWRASIKRSQNLYELVSDHREGWLTLWLRNGENATKLFETDSSIFSEDQELSTIKKWLKETSGK